MSARHPVYRSLLRLYPRDLRNHYGDELVQTFDDIVSDRGPGAANMRTGLDLVLTVPRYHLERIMTEDRSHATLSISIALLAAGVVAVVFLGPPGIAVIAIALVFAFAQRSHLARSLRVPRSNRRRQRFRVAAYLAATFVACFVTFLATVGDSWSASDTALAAIGHAALIGSFGFLIAGVFTAGAPKEPMGPEATTAP